MQFFAQVLIWISSWLSEIETHTVNISRRSLWSSPRQWRQELIVSSELHSPINIIDFHIVFVLKKLLIVPLPALYAVCLRWCDARLYVTAISEMTTAFYLLVKALQVALLSSVQDVHRPYERRPDLKATDQQNTNLSASETAVSSAIASATLESVRMTWGPVSAVTTCPITAQRDDLLLPNCYLEAAQRDHLNKAVLIAFRTLQHAQSFVLPVHFWLLLIKRRDKWD